jgi:hypothetical protein
MFEQLSVRKKLCAAYMCFTGATVFGAGGVAASIDRPNSISTAEHCNYAGQSVSEPDVCNAVHERSRDQRLDDHLALECMAACGVLATAGFLMRTTYQDNQQFLSTSGMENEYRALTGYSGLNEA